MALAAQRAELRKRIRNQRKKVVDLAKELAELQLLGHARAPGVEKRLNNAGNTLACLYFQWETGARLSDERVEPADETV